MTLSQVVCSGVGNIPTHEERGVGFESHVEQARPRGFPLFFSSVGDL